MQEREDSVLVKKERIELTMAKLWGGRFTQSTDSFTDHFHSSISFDSRMYKEDITGSMAHAAMLGRQGIIPAADAELIIKTLKEILADIEAGKVTFDLSLIHI